MNDQNIKMRGERGQSLVETILVVPVLLLLVCNVVNLGYFFLVVVNLTGASRSAALYSIEGSYTPYALSEPTSGTGSSTITTTPGTVAYTAYQDLTGAVWNPTGATVQVCTQMNIDSTTGVGVNTQGGKQLANCDSCTSSGCSASNSYKGSPAPSADPEAPSFVLNEIDINYTFTTLIPGTIFNLPLNASPMCSGGTCTFTRSTRMRSMGP